MSVKREEVARIAKLARLEFSDEELDAFLPQFQEILGYVDRLKNSPTSDAAPLYQCLPEADFEAVTREDRVEASLGAEQATANASQSEEGHFVVPKIIDSGD